MNINLREALVQPVPRLSLTREETADALGISVGTLDAWTREYGVPHIRLRRVVLYPIHQLQKWLTENSDVARPNSTDSGGHDQL
jgi:hypothetical protein